MVVKQHGHTHDQFSDFDNAIGKVLSVSHKELKRREVEWKKKRKRKRRTKA